MPLYLLQWIRHWCILGVTPWPATKQLSLLLQCTAELIPWSGKEECRRVHESFILICRRIISPHYIKLPWETKWWYTIHGSFFNEYLLADIYSAMTYFALNVVHTKKFVIHKSWTIIFMSWHNQKILLTST